MFKKFNLLAVLFAAVLTGSLLTSCSKEEGCLDTKATNYNKDADEPCAACCTYDSKVTVRVDTVTTTVSDTIIQDGDTIIVEREDTVIVEVTPGIEVLVNSNVTSNKTWSGDSIYILSGRIAVEDGATLTIEAGTIIKAEGGREANASALIIARGGKLMANGTAAKPIIFTSVIDEIQLGQIESPNMDPSFAGLWGGLIVLGKAPISADASEVQIEGVPPSDANGLYGGNVSDDNSGTIKYISIRHGGTLLGEGNEINGLTLGGVGSGTTIEFVEVVANLDDGIECFGGSVNITNALVWGQGDDAFDIDQAYSGTIDNFMFIGSEASDHGLEIDGPEGSTAAGFTMINGTLIGWNDADEDNECGDGGEYADFRDSSMGTISKVFMKNFCVDADFELDDNGSSTNATAGRLSFTDLEVDTSHLAGIAGANKMIADIFLDKSSGSFSAFNASIVSAATNGGADESKFSWTWAAKASAF